MDSVLDSPLTQTGVLIGTPAYMAPEQFSGKLPDPRSDQFAFCVTAWEALAGARPFRGTTLAELESASKGGAPTTTIPITELPPAIRAVLARGLDPDPARRWPDMRTLLDALETAAAPRADRRRFVWLGVAALGVLGAGIALVVANSSSKPDDRSRVVSITRSAGPADAARDHCDDPESAFATTWSPARRATMLRDRHPGELVGVFAILDDIRSQWTRAYRRACNAERTVEITSRLECLDSILVQIARATDRVANDPAGIADLGMLAASVMLCDPSSRNTVGEEIELSLPIPPPPNPPTTPPTAPKPPGTE
jgi:serine/threonine protein kinase